MDLTNLDPNHVQSMFDKANHSSTSMEIKDDVASFLDSICADNNGQIAPNSDSKNLLELNGNNRDLIRGDPFMGSFSNSILPSSSSNSDFGL